MKKLEQDAKALATQVVALWQNDKNDDAKALCDSKIEELLKVYSPATVAKNCQKVYRKAIIDLSGIDNYKQLPVSLFKVPENLLISVNQQSRQSTFDQRTNLVKVTDLQVDKLLETALNLLKNPTQKVQDIYSKACSLVLLTGRRPYSEILHYAEFEVISNHKVLFSGQAKGGIEKRQKQFEIPVLGASASLIVEAQNEVLTYIRGRDWYQENLTDSVIAGNCKRQFQKSIDMYFNPIMIDSKCVLSPHDLRKLYAFICWERLNNRDSAFTAYAPTILLHTQSNKLGTESYDTQTSECYEKFKLVELL